MHARKKGDLVGGMRRPPRGHGRPPAPRPSAARCLHLVYPREYAQLSHHRISGRTTARPARGVGEIDARRPGVQGTRRPKGLGGRGAGSTYGDWAAVEIVVHEDNSGDTVAGGGDRGGDRVVTVSVSTSTIAHAGRGSGTPHWSIGSPRGTPVSVLGLRDNGKCS